jgi:DNA-binding NarL/FixJ family response regulator
MSYSVLIVDDSKLARMSVAKLLNTLHPDWLRIEAGNADEAVQMVETAGADIALLDFNMPGRDGLELAADLIERKPGMPIALISANHQVEIINRAQAIGAQFLPKPLTQDALDGFLQSAVTRLPA